MGEPVDAAQREAKLKVAKKELFMVTLADILPRYGFELSHRGMMEMVMCLHQPHFQAQPDFAALTRMADDTANDVPIRWIEFAAMDRTDAMPKLIKALEDHLNDMRCAYTKLQGVAPVGIILPSERRKKA